MIKFLLDTVLYYLFCTLLVVCPLFVAYETGFLNFLFHFCF